MHTCLWPRTASLEEAGAVCTDEAEPGLDGGLPRLQSTVPGGPSCCHRRPLLPQAQVGPLPPSLQEGPHLWLWAPHPQPRLQVPL